MWFNSLMKVILVFGLWNAALGQPFLYNSAPSRLLANLASSASASASSRDRASETNIADLTRKAEKAEKLQAEKRLVEDDQFDFDIEEHGADTNEVQPSLVQKKINKILTKIRLLSTLSSLAGNDNRMEEDLEDFEFDIQTSTLSPPEPQTFQKVIYPDKQNGAPLKVNLKIGDVQDTDTDEETLETVTEENLDEEIKVMHKFGQIGVFFAELLGSIVGLAYGATAHLNNFLQGQGTTESTAGL